MPNEIICVGDSMTGWNYIDSENDWPLRTYPEFLQELVRKSKSDCNVINAGFNGDFSADSHDTARKYLDKYPNSAYFFFLFGTNDIADMKNYTESMGRRIANNISSATRLIIERSKIPFVLNIPYFYLHKTEEEFAKITNERINNVNKTLENHFSEEGIAVIDICSKLKEEHFHDGIHPNTEGARVIAGEAYKHL